MKKFTPILLSTLLFIGCGSSGPKDSSNTIVNDGTKYALSYKGLRFYAHDLPASSYKLTQVNDKAFNALSQENKQINSFPPSFLATHYQN